MTDYKWYHHIASVTGLIGLGAVFCGIGVTGTLVSLAVVAVSFAVVKSADNRGHRTDIEGR